MSEAGERVVQVLPLSIEYSILVITAPLVAPRLNTTVAEALPRVIDVIVGADGTPAGIPFDAALSSPAPCEFTARNLTEYDTPLVRPVIISGL
jgi:hypothetical protein